MPFPTARHAHPHVGATRGKRPHAAVRLDSPIDGLLRRGEPSDWQVRALHRAQIQCGNLRGVPQEAVAQIPAHPELAVLTTVQPASRPDQACLKAPTAPRDTQSILRPRSTNTSRLQPRASIAGENQTQCCDVYAALFRTLCLNEPASPYQLPLHRCAFLHCPIHFFAN